MPPRREILKMTPTEAYEQAARDGYRRAVKRTVFNFEPDAFPRWLRARPQYNDPTVLKLVEEGQALHNQEALESIVNAMPPRREVIFLSVSPDEISITRLVKK